MSKYDYSTKELLEKYKNYLSPKMKIKNEISKGTNLKIIRGLYETNKNVEPYLLAEYIKSPSYLSFKYALSFNDNMLVNRYNLFFSRILLFFRFLLFNLLLI